MPANTILKLLGLTGSVLGLALCMGVPEENILIDLSTRHIDAELAVQAVSLSPSAERPLVSPLNKRWIF